MTSLSSSSFWEHSLSWTPHTGAAAWGVSTGWVSVGAGVADTGGRVSTGWVSVGEGVDEGCDVG